MVRCSFLDDVINLSDHKPVQIWITFDTMCSRINYADKIDNTDEFETINLPPNLDNIEMCKKFNRVLMDQMKQYDNLPIDNFSDKQNIINRMYQQLSSSIRFAFDSCSSTTSINKLKKKRWFTNELEIIRNKMVTLRHIVDKNRSDIVESKSLKKDFKKIMKKNIYLYEKNELFKIEKLIKCNNSESFFRKVNKQLNNDKEKITLDINDLVNHYSNIFNRPTMHLMKETIM